MIVLSIGAVSAQDADDAVASAGDDVVIGDSQPTSSGTVSGGVDVVTENPWNTTGELSYDIPADAKTIKSADVYVNVYGGSATNAYGANANISFTTDNGKTDKSESLWIVDGTSDGTVYPVNDHTTKCYSDYMIHYDITDLLTGLNGTSLKINVDTFKMEDKQFDGRIKLIALVLAYDDGDTDEINYWINDDQLWTKSNVTLNFDTQGKAGFSTLTNVVLSSGDGTYRINNEILLEPITHVSGNYYQFNKWSVGGLIDGSSDTSLNVAYAGTSAYGSIKNVLSVLTIEDITATVSLTPEYYKSNLAAYAGTNNTITVTVNTNKAGKYLVRLLADGVVVGEVETDLSVGANNVLVTDPTIRAVDETTVIGNENTKYVKYTAEVLLDDASVNSSSINIPILYNGNLGKDLAYPAGGMESFLNTVITGDVVIDIKDDSSYMTGDNFLNRTDVWNINLDEKSSIVKAFVYVSYNWCDPSHVTEGLDMFKTTFNGVEVVPVALYRDQGNLGGYGSYGYGVLVYDVTDLVNKSGDNAFYLNKTYKYPAVYPSTLIYMYNTTGSKTLKEIYMLNGADLLAATGSSFRNDANRTVKADSTFVVDTKDIASADLYVFAAGAQNGEGDIVLNGEVDKNVWGGTSKTSDLYVADITGKVKDSNAISFVSTGGTILALQQIMVLTKNVPTPTTITAPGVTKVYNVNKNLVITLKDSDGKAVANAKVTVVLNGAKKVLTTNANGQVTLAIPNLVPKNYIATISYDGDDTHSKSSATTKVVVKKANVKLTAKNKAFKIKTKTKKYTVVLKNNKGKVMKKVKLTLKVKGKTYKATTNAKGKATFKITKLTKRGKFAAKITYKGDKYYNKVTKKVKITVKR